jgi:hypothetical protein
MNSKKIFYPSESMDEAVATYPSCSKSPSYLSAKMDAGGAASQ